MGRVGRAHRRGARRHSLVALTAGLLAITSKTAKQAKAVPCQLRAVFKLKLWGGLSMGTHTTPSTRSA